MMKIDFNDKFIIAYALFVVACILVGSWYLVRLFVIGD